MVNNPQLNQGLHRFTIIILYTIYVTPMGIVCCGNPLQGMVHDGESKTPARKMHQSPLDSTGCVKARGSAFDVTPFVGFPGPLPSMATCIQLQPQSSNS